MMDNRKKYPKVNEDRNMRRKGPLSRKFDKTTWINGSDTDVTFKGEFPSASKPSKPEGDFVNEGLQSLHIEYSESPWIAKKKQLPRVKLYHPNRAQLMRKWETKFEQCFGESLINNSNVQPTKPQQKLHKKFTETLPDRFVPHNSLIQWRQICCWSQRRFNWALLCPPNAAGSCRNR